jgi:malate dehydrogenase (oxaloacetate-decarboxylating)
MDDYKHEIAWSVERAAKLGLAEPTGRSLYDVVRKYRPTVLIGLSGVARSFNEQIVREMAAHVDRPIIFPSSNPSSISEAAPADLYAWTDGRVLVATGSPFPNVEHNGRVHRVGQGNNVFIFPGLGLAAIAANASRITDSMTKVASEALAKQVTSEERAAGLLFPAVSRLRSVSFEIAVAVAHQAIQDGVAAVAHDDVERLVREARWSHDYEDYVPA